VTCWSCRHVRIENGTPMCDLRKRPATEVCRLFDYDPGSDESEMEEA